MLNFALGVLVGIGLSGMALYGATMLVKPLSTLFTKKDTQDKSTNGEKPKMAQIINMRDPVQEIINQENND